MNRTENLGLTQFEANDKFRITQDADSYNHDMQVIDEHIHDAEVGLAKVKPANEGTTDQILRKNSSGKAYWSDPATQTEIGNAVTTWLGNNVPTGTTVVVDRSLSVEDAAADAKVTGGKLEELKSALNELIYVGNVVATGSGNNYLSYQITNGHKYLISSSSALVISIATVDSSNTTVQSVGSTTAGDNKTLEFTATADAPKVLFYFRAAGTVRIEDENLRVPVLESEMSTATSNINTLLSTKKDYDAYNGEINRKFVSTSSSGNYYLDYTIEKGKAYKFTTTCATNSVTVFTANANNVTVEVIGTLIIGTHSVTFIATADAAKVGFYFRAAGYGSIIKVSTVANPWTGAKWSSYGDSISWNYGWQTIVNQRIGFSDYVRNGKPGATISWSNSTFGINSNGIYTTDTPADTVHEGMCAYDRISKTIDNSLPLIFVMGGTNDYMSGIAIGDIVYSASRDTDSAWNSVSGLGDYDISTLKGAIASMFMKLQYHAPNALIVFGTLCNGIGDTTGENQYSESTNTAMLKPSDYAKAEKEVCEMFGIPCIDVFGECGINITNRATYISDTVHPNADGNKLLARCVASGLNAMLPR